MAGLVLIVKYELMDGLQFVSGEANRLVWQ
jgi:hypothetical protein